MNGAKLILSAGICLGVASSWGGCSTSSNNPGLPEDSGAGSDGFVADAPAEAGGTLCNPLADELCPQGQTCCFSGLRGTCTDVGSCHSPFQIGCVNTPTCGSGVCCGLVQLPTGFDASPFADASFDASAFDASLFALTLACAASCPAPRFQVCMTSQDCPSGEVCGGGPMGAPMPGFILSCGPLDAGASVPDAAADGRASASDGG